MKNLTEQQYADELINKYIPHTRQFDKKSGWNDYIDSAIQCAKIDVQNTIDALGNLTGIRVEYFKEVLTILNDMK